MPDAALERVSDAADLLTKATTATYSHQQGAIIGGNVASLWWWNQDGRPREGWHAIAVSGYWHHFNGGGLWTIDGGHRYNGTQKHLLPIAEATAFVNMIPEGSSNLIW